MSLLRDSLTTFSARAATLLVGIGISIIITRNLIPEDKGAYSYIILFYYLILLLMWGGAEMATIYHVGKKKYSPSEIASNLFFWSLLNGLVSLGVAVGFYLLFGEALFKGLRGFYLILVLSILPFGMLDISFGAVLIGKGLFTKYNLWVALSSLLGLVFLMFAVYVVGGGLLGIIIARVLGIALRSAGLVFLARKTVKFKPFGFNRSFLKDFFTFGSKGYIANVMTFLSFRLDLFMVKGFLDFDQLAFYSLAVTIAELVWHIPNSISLVLFTRVSSREVGDTDQETAKACRHTLFLSLWPILFLLTTSGFFIPLVYTSVYAPTVKPLLLLLPGVLMLSLGKVLASNLNGRGRPIIPTYAAGASLVANVSLNLFLIPRWGIVGAALASTISYTVAVAIVLVAFLSYSKIRLIDMLVIKRGDLGLYLSLLNSFFLKSKFYLKRGA